MTISHSRIILAIFTVGYLIAAAAYFASTGNGEFLGYIAAVAFLLALIACTLHITCLPNWLLWLISLLMLLHILGGGVYLGETRLYDYVVYPVENPTGLTFIKFDQIVHTIGSAIAALAVHFFLVRQSSFGWFGLFLLTVLAACGIGALNEVIEFIAKLNVPDSGVGGYYNTAVDLVVNLAGAVVGAVVGGRLGKRALES